MANLSANSVACKKKNRIELIANAVLVPEQGNFIPGLVVHCDRSAVCFDNVHRQLSVLVLQRQYLSRILSPQRAHGFRLDPWHAHVTLELLI
jgi:hypothetical protein